MKFVHTTLYVSRIACSEAFYQKYVGLHPVREIGKKIVFMKDEESTTELELIEEASSVESTRGIAIGFYCEKVGEYHEKLASEGLDVSNIIAPSPETQFFFVKDPDGYTVQFIN